MLWQLVAMYRHIPFHLQSDSSSTTWCCSGFSGPKFVHIVEFRRTKALLHGTVQNLKTPPHVIF